MPSFCIALVEDDAVIRAITAAYLRRQPEVSAVLEAKSAEDLLIQLDQALASQVVVLDIGLPGMSGQEAIARILKRAPDALLVMQTVFDDAETIYQALCQGARGCVLKSAPLPELLTAVLEVQQGSTPFSRAVSRKVLAHFKPSPLQQTTLLSPRERQVLSGLIDGLANKQIAGRLELGVESIQTYIKVKKICAKLHVNSRAELLSRAVRGHV